MFLFSYFVFFYLSVHLFLASVGFYQERVDNPICFTATNDMSSIRNVTTVTVSRFLEVASCY